ncbi:Glycosyltransferase [Estrella lausannensis]|uniref:Glycosyltransferase n=2 Tax=Estrella lausannensis TaxID=483423 RepID=A0A0H5DRH1_9BACT|nr:Glycosyltransferase [Estrella lausannensis]
MNRLLRKAGARRLIAPALALTLLLLSLISSVSALDAPWPNPDFISSYHRYNLDKRFFQRLLHKKESPLFIERLQQLKALYDREGSQDKASGFPKIIHQIWVGSPVPKKYVQWMRTWTNWQGWEYRLWTDKEVESIILSNAELYQKASNFGVKGDILRYEILYQFGGLYADTDFECLNPSFFELASEKVDLLLGTEPALLAPPPMIASGLIAAKAKHPLIKQLIDHLKSNFESSVSREPTDLSGPAYFTSEFFKYLQQDPVTYDIIFPTTFFYPLTANEFKLGHSAYKKYIHPETAAIHYYEGSWR